jgi:hypothetical protein
MHAIVLEPRATQKILLSKIMGNTVLHVENKGNNLGLISWRMILARIQCKSLKKIPRTIEITRKISLWLGVNHNRQK